VRNKRKIHYLLKYPSIPGNLILNQRQLEALTSDINETYELAIDMLDQMEELLNLKATSEFENTIYSYCLCQLVMQIMDSLRWSSLVPQGQCLLAPLIPVILDTSKLC
jgi:huntingtin interacting protein 1